MYCNFFAPDFTMPATPYDNDIFAGCLDAPSMNMFGNPFEQSLMDMPGFADCKLLSNPFDTGMSPEMAYSLGLIGDREMAFLDSIGPKPHETITFEKTSIYPAVGPSKEDWAEFDRHEAERADAVERYNSCLDSGDLDGAARWADEARSAQYAKETIYSVNYVTDIDKRAGLY